MENIGYNLAGFDHFKSEVFAEIGRVKYKVLEDMVYRMNVAYDEIMDILDVKYIAGSTNGYTLTAGISEITLMLTFLLPHKVKLKSTFDDIRLKSNFTTNKTIRFTKKFFS